MEARRRFSVLAGVLSQLPRLTSPSIRFSLLGFTIPFSRSRDFQSTEEETGTWLPWNPTLLFQPSVERREVTKCLFFDWKFLTMETSRPQAGTLRVLHDWKLPVDGKNRSTLPVMG